MCIQELDLEIKHNTNADALSRNPTEDAAQDRKQIAVSCAVSTEQADNVATNLTSELKDLNHSVMELHKQKMQEVRQL